MSRQALYSPQLLALAVELAEWPFDPTRDVTGTARSRTCGSTISLSCLLDAGGALQQPGLKVSACAVGQAAAAIFANAADGRTREEIERAQEAVGSWLAGDGPLPDWPRIELLAPAVAHPGRHEAVLLPWRAAADALSKPRPPR